MLDHEFIEFAASLPIGLKYTRDGRQKHILKEAVAPLLPPSLIARKKSGFSVPLRSWFAGPLMPLFQEQVLGEGRVLDYLTPAVVRHLFEENRQGRRDHGLQLWAILLLEALASAGLPSAAAHAVPLRTPGRHDLPPA